MYLPIQPQQTCVQAWLAAVTAVHNMNGHEAYNVVIDIENPLKRTEGDEQVIERIGSSNGVFAPPSQPHASAGGGPSLAAKSTGLAPSGSEPLGLAARCSVA